jgi:hypothetical protein
MFSVLILSAVLGIPTSAPVPAPASRQDPEIRIWLNDDGRYQRGDPVKVQVRARNDGYLLVLNLDPDRRLRVLFPLDPGDDNFIRSGRKYDIANRGGQEAFVISARSGHGTVYAAVSRNRFQLDRYARGDRWDLGALDAVRMSANPEADLNAFVRGLARSDFDYDQLGYDIYESVVHGGAPGPSREPVPAVAARPTVSDSGFRAFGPGRERVPAVAARPTVSDSGVRALGPGREPGPAVAGGPTVSDSGFRALAADALRRYGAALQAQRDLDWTRYGEEMRRVGVLLERLALGESEPQR